MKKIFFLGFGVGFIIAGLIFTISKKIDKLNIKPNITSSQPPADFNNSYIEKPHIHTNENISSIKETTSPDTPNNISSLDNTQNGTGCLTTDTAIVATATNTSDINNTDTTQNNFDRKKNIKINDISTSTKTIESPKEIVYYVQLRSSKNIDNCRELMDQIDDIEVKIIDTGDVYRLISIKTYPYKEALKVAAHLKSKYNINTYVNEF